VGLGDQNEVIQKTDEQHNASELDDGGDESDIESFDDEELTANSRLGKVMAETKYVSRNEANRLIRSGRVSFKGKVTRNTNTIAEMNEISMIEIDGVPLKRKYTVPSGAKSVNPRSPSRYVFPHLFAVNKYRFESMNTSENPEKHHPRALLINRIHNYLPKLYDISTLRPVYRLPYADEGLTLYTNNGELAKLFHSPLLDLKMTYRIRVHGKLTPEKIAALRGGHVHAKGGQRLIKCEELVIEKKLETNSWMKITTSAKDVKLIEQTFKTLYLTVNRAICMGVGPFELHKIFPDLYKGDGAKLQKRKLKNTDKQLELEAANAFKEVTLPPEIHKVFMQFQNNKQGRGVVRTQVSPKKTDDAKKSAPVARNLSSPGV
jgi:23S rRNA pseudouridine2605 synthase